MTRACASLLPAGSLIPAGRPASPVTAPNRPPKPPDARRGVYYVKPVLRGWLHLLWFGASLVLGTLLVARAHGAVRITGLDERTGVRVRLDVRGAGLGRGAGAAGV